MSIKITKSPNFAIYPMHYFQDFNFQPTEKVINTGFLGCSDGYYDP